MAERRGYSPPENSVNTVKQSLHETIDPERAPIIEYGDIPRPEFRSFTEQRIHTAGHELNHALVALDYGIMPESISVNPEGNSLGRTVFTGRIDTETFKVIAAGGAVDTAFGKASGFGSPYHAGSDIHQIHQLSQLYKGMDAHQAVKKASHSIGRVPEKVREKASEIIASMGEVSGEMLPFIIHVAELEVQHGVSFVSPTMFETIHTIKESQSYQDAAASGQRTVIGIDQDGTIQVDITLRVEKEVCAFCGEATEHTQNCLNTTDSDNKRDKDKKDSGLKNATTIVDFTTPSMKLAA